MAPGISALPNLIPEILARKEYDFKADIYSLGITMIELMTGLPPLGNLQAAEALQVIVIIVE